MPDSSPSEDNSSALQFAIDGAQPDRLRATLSRLCNDSKDIARAAEAILLVPLDRSKARITPTAGVEDGNADRNDDDSDESESDQSPKDQLAAVEAKRKAVHKLQRQRSRYAMCRNCNEEFNIAQNDEGGCVYHPDKSKVDWDGDAWADHDEDCHGQIDTKEMRRDYPDGFIYPCCDQDGESEGCVTNRHIERVQKAIKKRR
ncbi:MAG: hypothetical protein Q9204_004757 [Flavoplaca sp. TL-2023a]